MAFYVFVFVIITIPLLFLVCVLGGGMLGSYLGQQIGSFRSYASSYPLPGIPRHHMDWGTWLGSMIGWVVAVTLVLAFDFFGSIR